MSKAASASITKKLTIKLVKSPIGALPNHRATIKGLGLSKIRQQVLREDTDCIRGMVAVVSHLVEVTEN